MIDLSRRATHPAASSVPIQARACRLGERSLRGRLCYDRRAPCSAAFVEMLFAPLEAGYDVVSVVEPRSMGAGPRSLGQAGLAPLEKDARPAWPGGCADEGPWPCAEPGCPAGGVLGCAAIRASCSTRRFRTLPQQCAGSGSRPRLQPRSRSLRSTASSSSRLEPMRAVACRV